MMNALRAALLALLGLTLLAGCVGNGQSGTAAAGAGAVASWGADPVAASRAGSLGGTGSACVLPVAFEVAKSWKPLPVPGGVAAQGGFTLRCELDAKPAGHLGFLRVWVSDTRGVDPAATLEKFLAGQSGIVGRQTRTVTAGALPAVESTYLTENAELGVRRQERLLVVGAPRGSVLLSVGGVSLDEHRQLLPAYVLAKQSIAVSS